MVKIVIRPAKDDDLENIKQIAIEAWGSIYESFRNAMGDEIFSAIYSDWQADKSAQVIGHYTSYPECTLVTGCNDQIVGFITYNLFERKKLGIIGNNAIHPKYQGKGLGTKQYQRVLEIFKEKGMLYAEVTTGLDEAYAPARVAYEKVGFKPVFSSIRYCKKL
jgi:GNAT superfamily N-acetyltransferase